MKWIKTYKLFENNNYDIRDPKDYVNLDFVNYVKELSLEYLDEGCELEITANISVETYRDGKPWYMSNWPIYRCEFSQHRPEINKEEYTEFDINHLRGIYKDPITRDKYINGLFKAFDDIIYEVVLKTYRKINREDVEEFYDRIRDLVKLEFPEIKTRFVLGL